MANHMISTSDNPFSPVTDYKAWYTWDEQHGYHTTSYLARIIVTSDDLSEADQAQAMELAIDEIISAHADGLYIKVPTQ